MRGTVLRSVMSKLITPRRAENLTEKAQEYVRTHVLFPSALLGLILLLAATMALAYQYLAEFYEGSTFVQSTGLALSGALAGWGQSRYHRYLLTDHPAYFAARLRTFTAKDRKKPRQEGLIAEVKHKGRQWVPLCYVLVGLLFVGLGFVVAAWGKVYPVAAYLLPWAGFFCARVYAWTDLWGASQRTRAG